MIDYKGFISATIEKIKGVIRIIKTMFKYGWNVIKSSVNILLFISLSLNLIMLLFNVKFNFIMQQSQRQQAITTSSTTVWNTVENSNLQLMLGDIKKQGSIIVTNATIYKKDFRSYLQTLTPIEFATIKHLDATKDKVSLVYLTCKKEITTKKIQYSVETNTYATNFNQSLNTNTTLFQLITKGNTNTNDHWWK